MQEKERKRNKRMTFVLSCIAITFVVSSLPLHLFFTVTDLGILHMPNTKVYFFTLGLCHVISMSSCVSNPVLYGWLNTNLRQELIKVNFIAWRSPATLQLYEAFFGTSASRLCRIINLFEQIPVVASSRYNMNISARFSHSPSTSFRADPLPDRTTTTSLRTTTPTLPPPLNLHRSSMSRLACYFSVLLFMSFCVFGNKTYFYSKCTKFNRCFVGIHWPGKEQY